MRLGCSIRGLGILLLLAHGLTSPAKATIVEFDFDASLQTGVLAGTSFPGTGSYNTASVTGVGQEFVSLASLEFSLLGILFTASDIKQGGQAILQDGVLSYFTAAFFPPPPSGSPVSDIAFGFGGPGVIGYITPPQDFGGGVYTLIPVPAPSMGRGFPVVLAVGGILFGAKLLRHNKKRRLLGTTCAP